MTGNVLAAPKPPSFETRSVLAQLGAMTDSVTSGSFVYSAPPLIVIP